MHRLSPLLVCCCLYLFCVVPASATTGSDLFPVHDSMQPNVEFWTKVYAEHPSTKGLLHDYDNLQIIYDVIDLKPHAPGSRQSNRRTIKKAKEHYRAILDKLARGEMPASRDERRVYAMFGPNPKRHEFRQARDNIRCQTGQKDRFLAGLIRSGKYLQRIKDIFRSQGLPEDLAYLPHVESSFNYNAYSKFGAAGIWQFTRATGRRYMQVDYVVDERRDPIASTHAAAKFLKSNYEMLGCWALALTGYNHGPNGMLRAKQQLGTYQRIFEEYNGSRFKFASRNFYASFIAARHVAKNYRQYFGNVRLDQPVKYHTVELTGYAPLVRLAEFFHVTPEQIRSVNPALRPPVFDGQKFIPKSYRLRLPGPAPKMARMSAAIPSSLFERTQKRSKFYRVQRGDTAGTIARRHDVKLQELVMANGLNRRATIYVGQNLRIPAEAPTGVQLAAASKSSGPSQAEPSMASLKQKVLARAAGEDVGLGPVLTVAKWPPQANPYGLVAAREETAVQGPLVARVLKKRVAVSDPDRSDEGAALPAETVAPPAEGEAEAGPSPLVPAPQKAPAVLVAAADAVSETETAGDVLSEDAMPAGLQEDLADEEVPALATPLEGAASVEEGAMPNPMVLVGNFDVHAVAKVDGVATGTIQVEVEETLGHYADWLEIPTSRIRRLNGFRFGIPIHYGQKLQVPFVKVDKADFEERRFLYHKELVEDFFAAFKVEGEETYRVQRGDNLWALCHDQFELPFWLIKQYNAGFDFRSLRLGAEIKVPVVSRIDPDSRLARTEPMERAPSGRPLVVIAAH
ncbi:MAG: lytic transglycosylase [Desulfobulbaceae bacterium]|nr:MAG: lytic transglycosylase [Desulfobulbaceae bacterium]